MSEPVELEQFLLWTPPKLVPIISHGLMYSGTKVIIYGKYKSLKSMLATRLCIQISKGEQWLGFDTVRSSVMYLQCEIPNPMLQNRIKKMTVWGQDHDNMFIWTEPVIKIDTELGYRTIQDMVIKYKPAILVIDPIYKIVSGDLLNTYHIQQLTDWIDRLISENELSIVLIHHSRKAAADSNNKEQSYDSDDMLGSTIFSAWADTIIKIERRSSKDVLVRFDFVRHAEEELLPRRFDVDLNTLDFLNKERVI